MPQNIKDLFKQVENKYDFILLLSKEFNVKPNSIRNNWFASYYSIPEKYEDRVIKLLQNKIRLQNKHAQYSLSIAI
tara:strand:+ start:152 stop:379 length:228 start_codon:yes stop_codon:yes gene_type:complete